MTPSPGFVKVFPAKLEKGELDFDIQREGDGSISFQEKSWPKGTTDRTSANLES